MDCSQTCLQGRQVWSEVVAAAGVSKSEGSARPSCPVTLRTKGRGVIEHVKVTLIASLVLLSFVLAPVSSFAQAGEIEPYAGYYWSGTNGSGPGRFFNNQLL